MKSPTHEFTEDAIAGGWKLRGGDLRYQHDGYTEAVNEHEILLDPLAWQAVGTTRGWTDSKKLVYEFDRRVPAGTEKMPRPAWRKNMHHFIDHLAEGKDIETALAEIAK